MTLLQMKYFSTVCETGNISKAASILFVSRVTISRSIKELEEEFGFPLFSRLSSGLVMTEQGKILYEKCLDISHISDVLHEQIQTMQKRLRPEMEHTVTIGVSPTTVLTVFPHLAEEIRRRGVNIRLIPAEYNRLQSWNLLENGTIDCHLTADKNFEQLSFGVQRYKLLDTQLVFCMSATHPLSALDTVTLEDIKNEPLIFLHHSHQPDQMIDRLYARSGYEPNVIFRSFQMSTVKSMVKEGFGCTLQMANVIGDGVETVERPLNPPLWMEVSLVWNETIPHSAVFHSKSNVPV